MSKKTHAEIIAEMRNRAKRPDFVSQDVLKSCADELDAAHKREMDALKQRCAELDAEVAAKDEVIKRLNDALAEEQKRSGQVGNAAKLREFARLVSHMNDDGYWNGSASICALVGKANAALAAPPRNCDRYATVDEAMDDFADEALIEEWNALKAGKDRDMLAVELFVFTKWLFALSTEQEGGNDGNE